jgi:hypothetical protein
MSASFACGSEATHASFACGSEATHASFACGSEATHASFACGSEATHASFACGSEATHSESSLADSSSAVSSDVETVGMFAADAEAWMEASAELAEMMRSTLGPVSSWMGDLHRVCGPEAHPDYAPSAKPLRKTLHVFKVPTFTERFHGWNDDSGDYASALVAFTSFVVRSSHAVRLARGLCGMLARAYPTVEASRLRWKVEAESACEGSPAACSACPATLRARTSAVDPLAPFVDLADAVHRVAVAMDMTFLKAGDERATAAVWSAVLSGLESIGEWWRAQIREGAYPPELDLDDPAVLAGARLTPCSYVPAIARLNGWVVEALRGGLMEGAAPPGQGSSASSTAAADWSTLALTASTLLSETCRMLAAAGAVASVHVVTLPRNNAEVVRSIWKTCWDASMDFLVTHPYMVSHAGLSQAVGVGRHERDPNRVHIPSFNGWASRALGTLLLYAKQMRHAFGERAAALAGGGRKSAAGEEADLSLSASLRRRRLSPWPREPGPDARCGESLEELAQGAVRTTEVPQGVAWEFCTFGFLMMSVASGPYRSRRRPLLYLPPFRWDVLVGARGMVMDPNGIAGPVDVAAADFSWERTNVVLREVAPDEAGGEHGGRPGEPDYEDRREIRRTGFRGGVLHLTAHTVEAVRPVSFAYSSAVITTQPAKPTPSTQPTSSAMSSASRRQRRRHPAMVARRWEKAQTGGGGGGGEANVARAAMMADDLLRSRFQAQVRTVMANPAAWSFLGGMM